jgi:hypothetical protein
MGFFGPNKGYELEPEVDAYFRVNPDLRLLLQAQSVIIPSKDNANLTLGAFADWLIAPVLRSLLSPDLSKTRALNIRLGLRYTQTIAQGSGSWSQIIGLQADFAPRFFLPWGIQLWNRNRFQTRWTLSANDAFSFRYRPRFQIEREFALGRGTALTPFVNVEWYWQLPPSMWTQFRMEGGLQYSFGRPGRGQIIELNYSQVTNLEPTHSWMPVIGIIWHLFF